MNDKQQIDKFRGPARDLVTDESAEHLDRKPKKIVKPHPKDGDSSNGQAGP